MMKQRLIQFAIYLQQEGLSPSQVLERVNNSDSAKQAGVSLGMDDLLGKHSDSEKIPENLLHLVNKADLETLARITQLFRNLIKDSGPILSLLKDQNFSVQLYGGVIILLSAIMHFTVMPHFYEIYQQGHAIVPWNAIFVFENGLLLWLAFVPLLLVMLMVIYHKAFRMKVLNAETLSGVFSTAFWMRPVMITLNRLIIFNHAQAFLLASSNQSTIVTKDAFSQLVNASSKRLFDEELLFLQLANECEQSDYYLYRRKELQEQLADNYLKAQRTGGLFIIFIFGIIVAAFALLTYSPIFTLANIL